MLSIHQNRMEIAWRLSDIVVILWASKWEKDGGGWNVEADMIRRPNTCHIDVSIRKDGSLRGQGSEMREMCWCFQRLHSSVEQFLSPANGRFFDGFARVLSMADMCQLPCIIFLLTLYMTKARGHAQLHISPHIPSHSLLDVASFLLKQSRCNLT